MLLCGCNCLVNICLIITYEKKKKINFKTYFKVTRASFSIAASRAFISASITSGVLSESGAGGGALYGLENGTNFNSLGVCTAKKIIC